jgi:tetratricopeptide (TPR) repeat protein
MNAKYPLFGVFSSLFRLSGVFLMIIAVSGYANAQTAKWLDSAKRLPVEKATVVVNKGLRMPGTSALEKAHLFLLGGRLFGELASYDSAMIYLDRSFQAFTNLKDTAGVGNSYYETGIVYGLRGKYKESIAVQQKAFVTYQKTGNHNGATRSLLSLGHSNYKLKKYPESKQFYTQALERAQRNAAFEQMVAAYDGLTIVYEAQKDFKKAITSVRLMQGAYDSIMIRDRKRELGEVEDKYARLLEKKDEELVAVEAQHRQLQTDRLLRLIERDDIRTTFYAVALALSFVIVGLVMAWIFTQRQAKIAEMKLHREQAGIKTANEQFEIISRQIHDELSASMNDISFSTSQLAKLKSQAEIADAAMHVKDIGLSLIGNMMDMVWLINPNNRSLESLIGYIKEQVNAFVTPSGVNYMIVVPDKIPTAQLTTLERVNLYVVTQDLVRYAVNRSKATGLTLSITIEGRQMIFKVKDNSLPVDEMRVKARAEELKLLREKMEQIDGTIGLVMEQGAMVVIYRKDLRS